MRTRDLCGWTSLAPLTSLRSFEFEEWNNPVLSVGNLVVLTDESVCVMAGSWRGLEQLRCGGWGQNVVYSCAFAMPPMPCRSMCAIA